MNGSNFDKQSVLASESMIDNKLYEALENSKEVFVAIYDETTLEEVYQAYQQSKLVVVHHNYILHFLTGAGNGPSPSALFSSVTGATSSTLVLSDAGWSRISNNLATTESPEFTGVPKAPTAVAGTNTTQLATTAFVQNAVSAVAKIQTGSYVGNGKYGSDNSRKLTFEFAPKIVFIARSSLLDFSSKFADNSYFINVGEGESGFAWYSHTNYNDFNGLFSHVVNQYVFSGKSLEWYSTTGAEQQLNKGGHMYYYIAIG